MIERLTEFLKGKYKHILLLIVGVLMIIFSSVSFEADDVNDIEKNLKKTLEMAEGVGDVDVMITYGEDNKTNGAIIVAEGADIPKTKKMLHDCAVAVLDVPDYKIQILTKKSEEN